MTDEERKNIEWEYRVREFAFAIAPLVREFVDQNPEGFQKFLVEYRKEQAAKATAKKAAGNGANSGDNGAA